MTADTIAPNASSSHEKLRIIRTKPDQVLISSMKNVEIITALKELRFDLVTYRTVEVDVGVRDFLLDAVAARCGKLL